MEVEVNDRLFLGLIIIPLIWLLIYVFQGTYYSPKRIHRAKIVSMTFSATIIGSIFIFFVFILDDIINTYKEYYQSFLGLFLLHFIITLFFRYIIISGQVRRIRKHKDGFPTLLVGANQEGVEIYNELISDDNTDGNLFVGYIQLEGENDLMSERIPKLASSSEDLVKIIQNHDIEEVIVAISEKNNPNFKQIIARIYPSNTVIKVLPNMYDILSGSVRTVDIFGALLIEIEKGKMPYWQILTKRIFDIVASIIAIMILLPFYIIFAFIIKFSSKGPIFFLQERIGLGGKPFKIIKYRTMYVNAESAGPQLSSDKDSRITPAGKIFRKYRLDELPQFFNVLKGDMSLVGPRPERQFFIDQIIQKDPQYLYLNSVRPGITSWGQVKFGYAENVNQMIQRMKYDLLYLKNRSLMLDFRILIGTISTIIKAKGK